MVWLAASAPPLVLTACGTSPAGSPTGPSSATAGPTAPQPPAAAVATSGPTPAASLPASPTVVAEPTGAVATAATTPVSGASPIPAASPRAQASAAASGPATAATGTCVLSPEQTEGPYYIDENLNRSDITEGKTGVPLQLRFAVQNAGTCQPLANATIDIWHCDAAGVYSGYAAAQVQGGPGGLGAPPAGTPPQGGPPPGGGPGAAGGGGHAQPTNKETFLRGNQQTDAAGAASFTTIYPGWYAGRATHIHVKVHAGGNVVHTGQLYMDDALTDQIYAQAPYATRGKRDTTNATDNIYASGGAQSTLSMTKSGDGYVGTIVLGVKV